LPITFCHDVAFSSGSWGQYSFHPDFVAKPIDGQPSSGCVDEGEDEADVGTDQPVGRDRVPAEGQLLEGPVVRDVGAARLMPHGPPSIRMSAYSMPPQHLPAR
jgi:hypothetical protein